MPSLASEEPWTDHSRAAEEIKDASRVLPLGMLWTVVLNGVTGFIMVITFAFCVGDVGSVTKSSSGFAFIQVFYNSTGSAAGTAIMTCIIALMALCSTISNVATASRQMFAFARDGGLPFAGFLSHVRSPCPRDTCICRHLEYFGVLIQDANRSNQAGTFPSIPSPSRSSS